MTDIANSCFLLNCKIITGFNLPAILINKTLPSSFNPIIIFDVAKLNDIQINLVISLPILMF